MMTGKRRKMININSSRKAAPAGILSYPSTVYRSFLFFFFPSEIVSDHLLKVPLTVQIESNAVQNWILSGTRGLSSLIFMP